MKILFLSHSFRSGPFKVGSYHLSREFAERGHDVFHVSTPVSLLHLLTLRDERKARSALSGPTAAEDGVTDYVPLTVLPARWWWTQRSLRRVLQRLGLSRVDMCFIDQPLLAGRMPEHTTTVFRPTDVKITPREQQRAEMVMRSWADGLAATSPTVVQSLSNPRDIPTLVIENGVELSRFLDATAAETRRGFVYVGALDARFDFAGLRRLASELPEETFDIYGPVSQTAREELSGVANIALHGAVDYADVPTVLKRARVGLLTFTRSTSNTGRSPMKLYEYLAAGLVVLSSEEVRTDERLREFCVSYDHRPDDLAVAARAAITMPPPGAVALEAVAEHDWGNNAERLLSFAVSLAVADPNVEPVGDHPGTS